MSKINVSGKNSTKTTNYEAGEAYTLSPKAELLHLASTWLFREPKFYSDAFKHEDKVKESIKKVSKKDAEFILKLANYLRNEQYLRTASTYLLVSAANEPCLKGTPSVQKYTPKIIKRADEITEALAMHQEIFRTDGQKGFPNSLKRGIRDAFRNFDEYQFAKYNRKGLVTFKDAIMITHPKHPSGIIKKILDDNLQIPYTWETELSKKGNTKEVWEQLIDSGKLPYMALLRNLRNILNAKVSLNHIEKVASYISSPEAVKKSKQFPFRFLSAYKELEEVPFSTKLLNAVEKALEISFSNIPKLPGKTFIASDVSGSMSWTSISKHSKIVPAEIGLVLSAGLNKFTEESAYGLFADTFKIIQPNKDSGILQTVRYLSKINVGGSTNGWKAINWLNTTKTHVDRIFIFTDCQLYDNTGYFFYNENTVRSELNKYKQNINPNVKTYVIDLTGYGTVNFPESDNSVAEISGWSEKIFKFVEMSEKDTNAQIKYIEDNF